MENTKRQSIVSLMFFAFPLVFVIAAVLLSIGVVENVIILCDTETVEAKVVDVKKDGYWDADNYYRDTYDVKITYEYGGQEYRNVSIGTSEMPHEVGESITVRIKEDKPHEPYTTDFSDIIFPMIGVLAFGILGFCMLFFTIKSLVKDIKKAKENGEKITVIAFTKPSKVGAIVGIVMTAIVTLFIALAINFSMLFLIGAVVFGFFLAVWADCCLLK